MFHIFVYRIEQKCLECHPTSGNICWWPLALQTLWAVSFWATYPINRGSIDCGCTTFALWFVALVRFQQLNQICGQKLIKKIFSFSNCCIRFGGRFSIIGGVFGCIWFYDRRIRWTYFRNFGRFARIGETYECIRFAVAVPRHRNIHWTTNCWLTLRCFAVVHAWFSICWHHDCSERCDPVLHTVITKILCSTTDATGKHPNRKRDSIIVLIGLHKANLILSTKTIGRQTRKRKPLTKPTNQSEFVT